MGLRTVLGTADIYTYGPHNYLIIDNDFEGTDTSLIESVCCGIISRSFMMPIDGAE